MDSWGEWQNAKVLYDSKKYHDALADLRSHFKDSSHYFYNLGIIHYRLGELGASVAYFEKANKMRPHDSDIQYNLSIARSALAHEIGSTRLDPASTWAEQLTDRVTFDEVRATLGLLGFIVVLLWIRAYLSTRNIRKAIFNPAGLLGVLGFAITVSIYAMQRHAEATPPAVSLQKQAVRSGPGDQYMELSQLEAGTKVRLMSGPAPTPPQDTSPTVDGDPVTAKPSPEAALESWQQIRYSSDGVGWVKAANLLAL